MTRKKNTNYDREGVLPPCDPKEIDREIIEKIQGINDLEVIEKMREIYRLFSGIHIGKSINLGLFAEYLNMNIWELVKICKRNGRLVKMHISGNEGPGAYNPSFIVWALPQPVEGKYKVGDKVKCHDRLTETEEQTWIKEGPVHFDEDEIFAKFYQVENGYKFSSYYGCYIEECDILEFTEGDAK